MPEPKYMGCVIDTEFKRALMELYPNRKPNHPDQFKRKAVMEEKRDIPSLANSKHMRESIRCRDVPLVDLTQPRWLAIRLGRHSPILTKKEKERAIRKLWGL